MFLESNSNKNKKRGWIEVICGCMFSGKTEELIRRMKRAEFAQQKVEIYKPVIDNRYSEDEVVSHNKNTIQSTPVENAQQILLYANNIEVVGIDEAQFFDDSLPEVCVKLANSGVRVIIAGLDLDYLGRPFGPMPEVLALAEFVTKVHAICVKTGGLAHHSYRMAGGDKLVQLGETESYLPLSREAFKEAMEARERGESEKIDQELLRFVQEVEKNKEEAKLRREEILALRNAEPKEEDLPVDTATGEFDFNES